MKKAKKWGWTSKSRLLAWMLIVSIIVTALPVQQAAGAELPVQRAIEPELLMQQVAAVEPSGFQDVKPTDWFYDAAVYVRKNGIFGGTGGGAFSPKGTMTRAMYVTALGRMAGVDVSEYSASSFADVPAGIWYAPFVEWAVKKGITSGTGARNFSPDATVSREQMAALTLRYFESYQIPYQTGNPVTTQPKDLANVSSWAADAVVKLWQAGLFDGDSNGNFNPHKQATRAEAAVFFMRNNAIVEAWKNQNPTAPTPTPSPTSDTDNGTTNGAGLPTSGTGGGGGGNGGSPVIEYTLTFESNGGTEIADQKVRQGKAPSHLPAPAKEGYIFQGWFRDSDLSLIFAEGSPVNADTKLYAKYIDSVSNAVQSTPSYSEMDVAPDFTITVFDASGNLTASEVQAGLEFEDTSDPDFTGITVTGSNGHFRLAAEGGRFTEGHTYQLTLTDDNLSFQGQDATTSIYVFSVAKEEVMNVPLNPNMIYLPFADVTNMMLDGAEVGSPDIPLTTTTVGDSENGLAAANGGSGTFSYSGSSEIQVGAVVAIYEGVRPDLRTIDTTGADDGAVAYVQITAINGNTYTYDHADAKQVLFKPDVLPVSVEADTDGEPDNNSITVEHIAMNYSDSMYAPLGLSELTTVDVGDFIAFYEGELVNGGSQLLIGYGRITSITPVAEMDIIKYVDVTEEDIAHILDVYQQQAIDGDQLLSQEEIAQLEDHIEQQAIASGFVDQAADYLSALAMETDVFKTQMEVNMLAANGVGKVSVENLTVVAALGTRVNHIAGQNSGVSATLQIGADIVIRIHEESDLVIHMTGTFLQEITLNLGIDGGTDWGEACVWFLCVPYPKDYRITANLDAYTYTGINITAEIATVAHDKLQEALDDWDEAATGGKLGKVRDIATEMQALIDGVQDTTVDSAELKAQYQEMMENETDWVPLIKKKLFEKSVRVVMGIVEVNFTAEFVVSANVNLTIGADFNYTTAKRYSATVHVLGFRGTSNTVSLPGDGNYQFTFYVMGTIGLRAGVLLELKAGVGSVKLNSIGVSIEAGAYVNLWGYFYYQLKRLEGVQTTRSMGALYVEIGIYLETAIGAQLGDGLLSGSIPVYENTWPLYTVGEQKNVDDFAYPEDKPVRLNLAGSASSITVPESWLTMSRFDLKTGETDTQTFDRAKFDFQVDNRNFRYRADTGKIEVVNTDIQVSEGNLVITWRGAPLSLSSEPIQRTISLNWLARVGDYIIQLDLQNGEANQIVAAPYNAPISVDNPVYPGYTFDGWYWSGTGGSKATIPSRMPAQDWMLYARWIPNTDTPYTVQHYLIDPNTKTATSPAATETLTGTTGTEIQIVSDRFLDQGYATGKAGGMKIKGDGSTVVRVDHYPANRTMTFDGGYVGSPGSSLTEATGKNISARIPIPTRPGYTFAGWSPDVPSAMPATNTSYTAQWTAKEDTSYQVAYLLQNIGSDTYTVADMESYRGATDAEASLTNPAKSYEGFTFDATIPGTVLSAPISGRGTTVLKVYYKRNSYAMTINYNGSGEATRVIDHVPFGATTGLYLGVPAWQGSAFAGWSPASLTTMPAYDVEFTAQWALNTHTVSFNSNGGSAVNALTVGYGFQASEPDEPTKDDLVFGGWYRDSALTMEYDFGTQVTEDLALHAKWLHSYTVSFESNEGSEVADLKVNEGNRAMAPDAPTKEGFVFSGWYRDSEWTSAYDFETEIVTANLILYAKWVVATKISYTVSFISNNGTTVEDLTVDEGAVATAPGALTLTGYTFDGWYTDSTFQNRFSFATPVESNLTLYAKWMRNSYTVSFNSNGGSAVASQTVEYNDTATLPAAPTRNGHMFAGWYTTAGLGTAYNFSTGVSANLTLYAKWTAVYTVSFDSNGGSAVANQTVESGGNADEPAAPTMDGYTFAGWYSDALLQEAYSFTNREVNANLTLYAKWTFNSYTVSFDSNNGPAVQSQAVVPGDNAIAPPVPKWIGFRFDGWYSDPATTIAYDFSTAVNADMTLYAKWTMTSWTTLGDALAGGAQKHSDIVFDNSGTPYSAYVTWNNEIIVMKYEDDEWQPVGNLTAFNKAWNNTITVTLAIDSKDTLYVSYMAKIDEAYKHVVMKYDQGAWEALDLFTQQNFGYDASMVFDEDDNLYLSYLEQGNNIRSLYVKRYKDNIWENVHSTNWANANYTALAFNPSGTLYLFHMWYNMPDYISKTSLRTYDGSMSWSPVNNAELQATLSADASFTLSPDGVPYVVYKSKSNNEVVVAKHEGSSWQPVGTTGISYETSGAPNIKIAFDSEGTPYVAYVDTDHGNRLTVRKYENNSWNIVEYAGISAANISYLNLSIDSNDNLYVSYKEGITTTSKLTVMKYDPSLH